jgi:hypothetical protein
MKPKFALSLAAILLLSGAAFAQDASKDASLQSKLAPATRKAPSGTPGYMDMSTGRFTPLVLDGPAASTVISGVWHAHMEWNFTGLRSTDTVFCVIRADFGNLVKGQFFSNHSEQVSFNFAVGDPLHDYTVVGYKYAPNSSNSALQLTLECRASDDFDVLSTNQDTKEPQRISADSSEVEKTFDLSL